MKRRVFRIGLGLSLLLLAAAAGLWVRSYFVQDTLYVHRSGGDGVRFRWADHRFYSVRGQLLWRISTYDEPAGMEEMHRKSRETIRLKDVSYHTLSINQLSFNPVSRSDPLLVRWGFRLTHYTYSRPADLKPGDWSGQKFTDIGVPHWLPVAMAGVIPLEAGVGVLRRWRQRRRSRSGRCARCGYDLRATPGRCPECGSEPAMAAEVATSPVT